MASASSQHAEDDASWYTRKKGPERREGAAVYQRAVENVGVLEESQGSVVTGAAPVDWTAACHCHHPESPSSCQRKRNETDASTGMLCPGRTYSLG